MACLFQQVSYFFCSDAVEHRCYGVYTQIRSCHSQVGLHYLTNVHSTGNTKGVKAYVHRSAVGEVGHILFWNDYAHNSLVTVPTRHFVSDAELPALGNVNLHKLYDSRFEFISSVESVLLVLIVVVQFLQLVLCTPEYSAGPVIDDQVLHYLPVEVKIGELDFLQEGRCYFSAFRNELLAGETVHECRGLLSVEHLPEHVVPVGEEPLLGLFTLLSQGIDPGFYLASAPLGIILAGVDFNVNDYSGHPHGSLQGRILNVTGSLAEDGSNKSFLGRQVLLALGAHLTHQDIAGADPGPYPDYSGFVQIPHCLTLLG